MRRAESIPEELTARIAFAGAAVVDVGCGTGDTTRWLARLGARVVGVDQPRMVALAGARARQAGEQYVAGTAQQLPLSAGSADLVLYLASLHHVPRDRMAEAVAECGRVLRPGGRAVVVEPVGLPGSYYEVVRLEEDEREVQRLAQEALQGAWACRMSLEADDVFYVERSLADYERLIEVSVADTGRRTAILEAARQVTARMAAEAGLAVDAFRFQSICRMKLLRLTAATAWPSPPCRR